jgi:hypothetical protein
MDIAALIFFASIGLGLAYVAAITAIELGVGRRIVDRLIDRAIRRKPDFIVGGADRPYLMRWWLIPRNRFFNVYLHQFLRSDDDRALHDHPWMNASLLLCGAYLEHTIAAGGIEHRRELRAGDLRVRLTGRIAHRIELHKGPCWTLFLTGPVYREWGFHCPEDGWIHWKKFTARDDAGAVGAGCDAGKPVQRGRSDWIDRIAPAIDTEAASALRRAAHAMPGVDIDAVHRRYAATRTKRE